MYIESEKVKFYPSAYRQYQDGTETKNINPESELNTEYNITSHIAKLLKKNKGSFIVDYVENVKLEFYLGGYYIHITSPQDILGAFSSATEIWANMKVAPFTPTDNTERFSELYEVIDYEDSGKNIDEWSEGTVLFKGVAFSKTKDNSATFSLQLFARQDTTKPWSILESSKYILDTREIFNFNGDYSIDEDFYTLYASIDDLYSETSSIDEATINTALTVNGTANFNSQVDLNADLIPTTNNTRNIGSSGNEFANIYVNKVIGVSEIDNGQNNIVLKSTIEPSGTIDLGLSTAPITNIYATNIYGTSLKDVSEIDGGQNSITLKSDIVPNSDNTVVLGSSSSKFKSSYVGISYVNTLTSLNNEIKVAKNIIPSSYTTLYIGDSTNNVYAVYSQYFYGSLMGNASTATKLNGTNVGNTSSSIYFDNGVPVASKHHHYMKTNPNSSGTITIPYDSSNPTQTPVSFVGSTVYLKAGRYSFSFQDSVLGILGSGTDGTVVDVIIPTDLSLGSMQSTTTKYTQASFLGMVPYNESRGRQEYWYSRLRALHTTGSSNVILAIQLGIGYLNSDESLTLYGWSDVLATISTVVDYFN